MAITLQTKLQVDSTSGAEPLEIINMTATTAIVVYFDGTDLVCRLLTYSGGSLSQGAITTIKASFTEAANSETSGARLTDTTAMYIHTVSGATDANILTVSGTTITLGSTTTISDEEGSCISTLNSTNVIYVGRDTGFPLFDALARVLSVSGTTITANAILTFDANISSNHMPQVAALTATEACVIWVDRSNDRVEAEGLDISGTTITGNTSVEVSTNAVDSGVGDHPIRVAPLTSTTCLVSWDRSADANISAMVLTVSSGTITTNTEDTSFMVGARPLDIAIMSATSFLMTAFPDPNYNIEEGSISGTIISNVDSDNVVGSATGKRGQVTSLTSTLAIITWRATTEAQPISLAAFSGYDLILGGGQS